jgi:hypothetical protein
MFVVWPSPCIWGNKAHDVLAESLIVETVESRDENYFGIFWYFENRYWFFWPDSPVMAFSETKSFFIIFYQNQFQNWCDVLPTVSFDYCFFPEITGFESQNFPELCLKIFQHTSNLVIAHKRSSQVLLLPHVNLLYCERVILWTSNLCELIILWICDLCELIILWIVNLWFLWSLSTLLYCKLVILRYFYIDIFTDRILGFDRYRCIFRIELLFRCWWWTCLGLKGYIDDDDDNLLFSMFLKYRFHFSFRSYHFRFCFR